MSEGIFNFIFVSRYMCQYYVSVRANQTLINFLFLSNNTSQKQRDALEKVRVYVALKSLFRNNIYLVFSGLYDCFDRYCF